MYISISYNFFQLLMMNWRLTLTSESPTLSRSMRVGGEERVVAIMVYFLLIMCKLKNNIVLAYSIGDYIW